MFKKWFKNHNRVKKLERDIRKLKEEKEREEEEWEEERKEWEERAEAETEEEEKDIIIKRYRELVLELGVEDVRDYFDGKNEEARDNFISNASLVYKNHTFSVICEYFIKKYTQETINDANNWEYIQKGRMILVSIMMIYREFNNLNTMHEERLKNQDEYDNNDII